MSEENVTGQEQSQNQQENEGGKVEKAFARNLEKLSQILNKDPKTVKNKVAAGTIPVLVAKMLEEREEKTAQEVSDRLSKVLDQYIAFNRFVKQKEAELVKTITEKKKEFNKEMEACFGMIDNIGTVANEYKKLLEGASGQDEHQEGEKNTNTDEDLHPGQA